MAHPLVKNLQRVAAKKLKNTRSIPKSLSDKVELVELAYGRATLVADFELWCDDPQNQSNPYPVTAYLRSVDSRLGQVARVDPEDPRIAEIQAAAYEAANVIPNARHIRDLLLLHSSDDIKAALKEYILVAPKKEIEAGLHNFFENNGAGAVIAARKKRGL